MKRVFVAIASAAFVLAGCSANTDLVSPNGKIAVSVSEDGHFTVCESGVVILDNASLGYKTAANDFSTGLKLAKAGKASRIDEEYDMLAGKRLHCTNSAVERTYTFKNEAGASMQVEFRAYNDGAAFRYILSGDDMVMSEETLYPVADGTKRWMSTYSPDSYERMFPLATDGKAQKGSPYPWVKAQTQYGYPALVEPVDGHFMLITESDIRRGHPGSLLDNSDNENAYKVLLGSDSLAFKGNWESPWRTIIAGSLADIVESTLVTDLAEPSKLDDTSWIKPGIASWIYWAYNHGSQDLQLVKEYIDLAAEMKWPYSLIDAEWDLMGNGGDVYDALAYAREKGVKPMLWYNCSIGWINGAPTPKFRLNEREDRLKEYQMLKDNGVTGIKIDFFPDDKASTMDYYLDLLEDAVPYHLTLTFHGATVPRGWQRTYPNLMTVEAVYGAEWYNNNSFLTTRAAVHNTTIPFTRNVVGPMDYTPGTFTDSQNPHITSDGHELALMVAFESAMQHMPDRPSAYAELPDAVRTELMTLPTVWDDTKLLAGYPGQDVVIARRSGDAWYIAGLNGRDEAADLSFSLERLGLKDGAKVSLYADGTEQHGFTISSLDAADLKSVHCIERGGFLAVIR